MLQQLTIKTVCPFIKLHWETTKNNLNLKVLKLETMFSSCISKGFNSTMIRVSTSVKGHLCDAFLKAGLCNYLTNSFCHINSGTSGKFELFRNGLLHCWSRSKCVHFSVVNDLSVEMFVGAKYTKSWSFWCAFNLLAYPGMTCRTVLSSGGRHGQDIKGRGADLHSEWRRPEKSWHGSFENLRVISVKGGNWNWGTHRHCFFFCSIHPQR